MNSKKNLPSNKRKNKTGTRAGQLRRFPQILCLVFLFSLQTIHAQTNDKDTIPGTKGKVDVAPETPKERKESKRIYSVKQFAKESFLFVRQPLRWKAKDWLHVGEIAAGTALLTLADQPLRDTTQGAQKYYHSFWIEGGRIYGEAYSIGGVAAIFGLVGLIANDTSASKMSIELVQAGLYSELVTVLLKMSVGRARPYMDRGAGTFKPFVGINTGYNSYPSGHSTSAFALSTVMSRHADPLALKIAAYIPAGFTLFSRIYQDKHWVSDELLGAAFGFFVGNWVVDLHEEPRHRINITSLYPIGVSYSFK